MKRTALIVSTLVISLLQGSSELIVQPLEMKTAPQKVVVEIQVQNPETRSVTDARVLILVQDDRHQVIGRRTLWLFGGKNEHPLPHQGNRKAFAVVEVQGQARSAVIQVTRVIRDDGKVEIPKIEPRRIFGKINWEE